MARARLTKRRCALETYVFNKLHAFDANGTQWVSPEDVSLLIMVPDTTLRTFSDVILDNFGCLPRTWALCMVAQFEAGLIYPTDTWKAFFRKHYRCFTLHLRAPILSSSMSKRWCDAYRLEYTGKFLPPGIPVAHPSKCQ